jgi:hypothetical protein
MSRSDEKKILTKCLKKLTDPQYVELISVLVPAKNQDDFTNRKNKSETLSDFERWNMLEQLETALREKWPDLLEKELVQLSKIIRVAIPEKHMDSYAIASVQTDNKVPFTNREDEISQLISEFAPAYYLVDAPAGYGKTALLETLEKQFTKKEWVCARASFQDGDNFNDVATTLADVFGVTLPKNDTIPLSPGVRLGSVLYQKFENLNNDVPGVVLLIDLDKKPSIKIVQELMKVIRTAREIFGGLFFFIGGHNRFRVVLAGRNLATRPEIRDSELPFSVLRLSPFSYDVIQKTVRQYRPKDTERSIKDLSAHLFYMTGGHPGCIIKLLHLSEIQVLSSQLSNEQDEQIWKTVVRKELLDIRDGLYKNSPELMSLSDQLGILRILDYFILRRMREPLKDKIQMDEYQLADQLTSTYLLDWKGRVLRDDIARRLLTIGLRHEYEDFSTRCRDARKLCAERLKQPNTQMPERWLIEYLFQSLQLHGKEIFDRERRHEIREDFYNIDLPFAWKIFSENSLITQGGAIAEQRALEQAFEEDWEFRFTINYYLREDRYDDSEGQPYNKLRNKVDDFFKNIR